MESVSSVKMSAIERDTTDLEQAECHGKEVMGMMMKHVLPFG